MTSIQFAKFEGTTPGNIRSCDILVDNEYAGVISVDWTDSTPGMMSHRYVVGSYWVELESGNKNFDVGADGAKAALKAAKDYVRAIFSKVR